MANSIKDVGGSLALQITKPARAAGLVEENAEGDVEYRARVLVHAADEVLLVVDRDRVDAAERAELVAALVGYRESSYRAVYTRVQPKGHGYQIVLGAPCVDAGLELGTTAPVWTAPGMLLVTNDTAGTAEVARSLVDLRESQLTRGR